MENGAAANGGAAPFYLLAALLVFAPLILGGNRPLPLLVLELMGIASLALLAWQGQAQARLAALPLALRLGAGLLVVYPLLQLVPLPAALWAQLPGHGAFAAALAFAAEGAAEAMRPITLHARGTEFSWLVVLPCAAAFLLALAQRRRHVRKVVAVFVVVALAEALLGVLQLGSAAGSPLYLGNPYGGGAATGTYVNRNHFAALMAMALPAALVLWFLETRPPTDQTGGELLPHPARADRRLALQIALAIPVLLMLVALVFSLSRGGIGAGMLAFALMSLALVRRALSPLSKIAFAMIGAGAITLGAYIGFTPVLDRFASDQLSIGYEGRLQIAAAGVRAGVAFLPFGSGLGTFAQAFAPFQPEGLPGFVDHAHNDYVELFADLGVVGIAIVALLAAAYVMRWGQVLRADDSRSLPRLQAAAGLGMLAMILHGLVDFNFHIPANAIYFSFLAGLFYHPD
jgi:O-antigen ligase